MSGWKEFKLTITDPPSYKGHFELIRKHLIPFVEKMAVRFWITNYFDSSGDYILFRLEVNEKELEDAKAFLNNLANQGEIVRYDPSKDWDPEKDAQDRIVSASGRLGLPPDVAFKVQGPYVLSQEVALDERVKQLELIFTGAIGPCIMALYKALKSKPTDPWMMSLFVHLVLNSLDINGPDAPSEESAIRFMPVY